VVEHKIVIVFCRAKRAGSGRDFKLIERKPTIGVCYMKSTLNTSSKTFPLKEERNNSWKVGYIRRHMN